MRALPCLTVALLTFVCVAPALAADGALDGVLRDESGKPVAAGQLVLRDGAGKTVATTTSDATGQFAFPALAEGSYVVMATKGDAVLGSATIAVRDAQTTHEDVRIQAAAPLRVVIAQRRAAARNSLSPKTGTSAYRLDQKTIEALPNGADTSLNKVLLQAPGVAADSAASGATHVRGEHADLQYRLNGILLPDGISGFGDTIDTHVVENATLLDGALPAQYGFRTAGVLDISTRNGFQNGGEASLRVGSNGTLQPSVSYGGTYGDADYFVAASHLSSDLGIENPTRSANAIHDHTEQDKQFAYGSAMIDPMQRVELVAGNSIGAFEIPNNPNQPTAGYKYNGISAFNSANLNERQFESNQYATLAWQGGADGLEVQVAPYLRHSELHYRPDPVGDLLFNGVASDVLRADLAAGVQNDTSWRVNAAHTLRAGFTIQNDHVTNANRSLAFVTDSGGTALVDGSGNNIVSAPIVNNQTKDGQLYGLYLQDEWKITDALTLNYGARFDAMAQYTSASQLSPRLGFVYKATSNTAFHAGYARYFTPPPMELVSASTLNAFANTTNAPAVTQNDPVKPERQHSFDAGVTQNLGDHWQVGLDGYYKIVRDLLDEGQFGQALILTPFNYAQGHIYGAEFSATYTGDKLKAYGNLAFSRAMGTKIESAQFNFSDPAELAFIQNHYVHLDHDQTLTASAGATYDVRDGTELGIDGHYGSGLRKGFANTETLPGYVTFDVSVEQKLDLVPRNETSLRLSVINLLDSAYQLRDGSGIGVGAPQWGARRGVFLTLAQKF